MLKKLMLFLAVLLMVSSFAYAEEKFTVSGEVTIQYDYDADIYMSPYYGRITSFTYPRA
jgi:hypothetical protein